MFSFACLTHKLREYCLVRICPCRSDYLLDRYLITSAIFRSLMVKSNHNPHSHEFRGSSPIITQPASFPVCWVVFWEGSALSCLFLWIHSVGTPASSRLGYLNSTPLFSFGLLESLSLVVFAQYIGTYIRRFRPAHSFHLQCFLPSR
ncbi:hypothetical protein QBC46DRAFT_154409 [Diplogelasinospora grovesii]|uniref:Uncharacterized protein n=1 Tax=Diplogelasinospora grovesii TaxID=303347 RepID=A0AAN6N5B9_9PEZI|nr:hypothetical protein QBC46DRAFT_154409 [Diplogelasinospora grovesii]